MKYKVIKKLYDPFTKRIKNFGEELEIQEKYRKLYGDRVEKIETKKSTKKSKKKSGE